MKTNQEVLSSMLKTTQMGQIGIRCVMDYPIDSGLRSCLESQLKEYDAIETEANRIAGERNWQTKQLNPGIRRMSEMTARMKLSGANKDSKIAAMMIQGNTRGLIKGGKNMHHLKDGDRSVAALSRKLMQTESDNVRQMQQFL